MDIHVVQPGDTLYRLARQYGVSMDRLIYDNQLPDPSRLVVGQTILVRYPQLTYTVKEGDTLWSIARDQASTVRSLLRGNPNLKGKDLIYPGQVLVIQYRDRPQGKLTVGGYAYPWIDRALLTALLPYQSWLIPFAHKFTPAGELLPLEDQALRSAALQAGVAPVLSLANLDEKETFSSQLVHQLLASDSAQAALIAALLEAVDREGYRGVDVDFEYVYGQDAQGYAQFLARLREGLTARGFPLSAALAAKTSDDQPGRLYEGHDYRLIAQAVDYALLMTYDWGYVSGPPMAVSPLPQVREVLEYALTRFRPDQLFLGIPNYGYDWPLPYKEGNLAKSIGNQQAVSLAWDRHAAIRFDERAQAPWFRYTSENGREHEVWFEDARSARAKVELALEYGLHGVGYWNLDRPFPQGWGVLSALANIAPGI